MKNVGSLLLLAAKVRKQRQGLPRFRYKKYANGAAEALTTAKGEPC